MKIRYVMLPLLALTLTVGCKQAPEATEATVPFEATEPEVTPSDEPETAPVERVPVLKKAQTAKSAASSKASATSNTRPSGKNAKSETIYVETDGAQGRVWGHVTMKGDRGTGTIHDWDENTWAVNVTRHGDELFAVDQNSRLYVFKLK